MTLSIQLTDESQALLRARAAAEGKDIESFVRDAIEEKLASGNGDASRAGAISADKRAESPTNDPIGRPIWEIAGELTASVPQDVWATVPTDLARNLDHYLYGAPREDE